MGQKLTSFIFAEYDSYTMLRNPPKVIFLFCLSVRSFERFQNAATILIKVQHRTGIYDAMNMIEPEASLQKFCKLIIFFFEFRKISKIFNIDGFDQRNLLLENRERFISIQMNYTREISTSKYTEVSQPKKKKKIYTEFRYSG